jgi:hypothetical protein
MGATWQPMTGPHGTLPLANKLPRVKRRFVQLSTSVYPVSIHCTCHIIQFPRVIRSYGLATSACPTCHPCSGATCHTLTRPSIPAQSMYFHISMPTHPATSPVWSYGLYIQLARQHCTDCMTVQSSNFACLEK